MFKSSAQWLNVYLIGFGILLAISPGAVAQTISFTPNKQTYNVCAGSEVIVSATVRGYSSTEDVSLTITDGLEIYGFSTGKGQATVTVIIPTQTAAEYHITAISHNNMEAHMTINVVGIESVVCDQGSGPFCTDVNLSFTAVTTPVAFYQDCTIEWTPSQQLAFDGEVGVTVKASIGPSYANITIPTTIQMTVKDHNDNSIPKFIKRRSNCIINARVVLSGGFGDYNLIVSRDPGFNQQQPVVTKINNETWEVMIPAGIGHATNTISIRAFDSGGCKAHYTIKVAIFNTGYTITSGRLEWENWQKIPNTTMVIQQKNDMYIAASSAHLIAAASSSNMIPMLAEAAQIVGGVVQNPYVKGAANCIALIGQLVPVIAPSITPADVSVDAMSAGTFTVQADQVACCTWMAKLYCVKHIEYYQVTCSGEQKIAEYIIRQPVDFVLAAYLEAQAPPRPAFTATGYGNCPVEIIHAF